MLIHNTKLSTCSQSHYSSNWSCFQHSRFRSITLALAGLRTLGRFLLSRGASTASFEPSHWTDPRNISASTTNLYIIMPQYSSLSELSPIRQQTSSDLFHQCLSFSCCLCNLLCPIGLSIPGFPFLPSQHHSGAGRTKQFWLTCPIFHNENIFSPLTAFVFFLLERHHGGVGFLVFHRWTPRQDQIAAECSTEIAEDHKSEKVWIWTWLADWELRGLFLNACSCCCVVQGLLTCVPMVVAAVWKYTLPWI